jgi:CRISPR-associated protein Csa3
MKTYISPLGFDTTHIISLIVKHGIEKHDRIILLRPVASDSRADRAVEDIKNLTTKIDSAISLDVVKISPWLWCHNTLIHGSDSLSRPTRHVRQQDYRNLSGGPRDILIALTVASMALSDSIYKTTNWRDIDREFRELELPHIARTPDKKMRQILDDILKHAPTTLTAIAARLGISESTISRSCAKLANIPAIEITPIGRNKQITLTLSGRVLLSARRV